MIWKKGNIKKVEYAFSTCAETKCGIVSTLSSKEVQHQKYGDLMIHQFLHQKGYHTFFITYDNQKWRGTKEAYVGGIDFFFDAGNVSEDQLSMKGDKKVLYALSKVPSKTSESSPAFFFIFLGSTHHGSPKE